MKFSEHFAYSLPPSCGPQLPLAQQGLQFTDLALKVSGRLEQFGDDEPSTGRAPHRLLHDGKLGTIREAVVDEGGQKHPLVAPRIRQVVLDESSAHHHTSSRITLKLTCRGCRETLHLEKP
jgi:hypothetical protein